MSQFFPNSTTLAIAALVKLELEDSKLRLFKSSFVPSISTTRAILVENEAAFTGYPAGGAAIAAFLGPIYSPTGGAVIEWPTVMFLAGSPYTVGDVVGGWWLESDAGVVYAIGTFTQPIPIGAAGQGIPISGALGFPNGQ